MSLIEGNFFIPTDLLYIVLNVCVTEGVPKQVRMAHLACVGEAISLFSSSQILINIDLFKGSRKVNGVAEVLNIIVLVNGQVLTGNSCIANLSVRLF